MNIDRSSAAMTFTKKQGCQEAFSRARAAKNLAAFNLGRGFQAAPPGATDNAVRIEATVDATVATGESLAGWVFNFVQVCEIVQQSLHYAGERKTDGSIVLSAHRPPSLTDRIHLDSGTGHIPFTTNSRGQFHPSQGRFSNVMGDHPMSWFPIGEKNRTTNKINWLVEAQDFRRFWTVCTIRDPSGTLDYLGYVRWKLFYTGRVSHSSSSYQPTAVQASLSAEPFKAGMPPEKEVQAVLGQPGPPLSNDLYARMWTAAVAMSGSPNRSDLARRGNIPAGSFS